jgi:hypothetical protein
MMLMIIGMAPILLAFPEIAPQHSVDLHRREQRRPEGPEVRKDETA